MQGFSFNTVNQIVCALGSRHKLGEHCQKLGIRHVLFVTDQGILKQGLHQDALDSLTDAAIQVTLYADVQADPPEQVVLAATQQAKQAGIDGVIGYGGGSSMDVAKLIALLAHPNQQQTLAEIYGVEQVRGQRLPLIQVPTTAGTGSEVTAVAIVTTGATSKMGVVSSKLLADLAILDAELTTGLPAAVTAATGIDAMVHAIEAFTSRHKKNPYSDLLAIAALKALDQHLQTAIHQGSDLLAREQMLWGAMLAGQAFANAPVAAVHALAYPLGGRFHVSHGLSNALVLIAVMRFNLPNAAPLYAQLARALRPDDVQPDDDDETLAKRLIRHLEQHIIDSGLPRKLSEVGVSAEDLPQLAHDAMQQTRLLINNPREVTAADALAIYQSVLV